MKALDIFKQSTNHFLKPIVPLLDDPAVSEIMINGPDHVFFEKNGKISRSDAKFESDSALLSAARNIAQFVDRSFEAGEHSMDARLPDGSRVHVILSPCSRQGTCITIRKFKKVEFSLNTLVEWGSVTEEAARFLRETVQNHKNIIISGGTGTGKTSLLNALSSAIPETERIIVIEDSSELQLNQPHTLYLEAQPPDVNGNGAVSIRDLFIDSLRMRPDRIVVGEVRRGEALDLIQSMLSGHDGSLSTVHASTPIDAASRLETLSLMSDVGLPLHVARSQIASAIHYVIQLCRYRDGARKVSQISRCIGLDSRNNYQFEDLFLISQKGKDGKLVRVDSALET